MPRFHNVGKLTAFTAICCNFNSRISCTQLRYWDRNAQFRADRIHCTPLLTTVALRLGISVILQNIQNNAMPSDTLQTGGGNVQGTFEKEANPSPARKPAAVRLDPSTAAIQPSVPRGWQFVMEAMEGAHLHAPLVHSCRPRG